MPEILFVIPDGANGIPVYTRGVAYIIVVFLATWLGSRVAKKVGYREEGIQVIIVGTFAIGFLIARMWQLI